MSDSEQLDDFSRVILNSLDTVFFNGDVPANWWKTTTDGVKAWMNENIHHVTIEGNVDGCAFSLMQFSLESLIIKGKVEDFVFDDAEGFINNLTIGETATYSFNNCKVNIEELTLTEAADSTPEVITVYVKRSSFVKSLKCERLVITESFDKPIDLDNEIDIVDFTSVEINPEGYIFLEDKSSRKLLNEPGIFIKPWSEAVTRTSLNYRLYDIHVWLQGHYKDVDLMPISDGNVTYLYTSLNTSQRIATLCTCEKTPEGYNWLICTLYTVVISGLISAIAQALY